jgi:hypothetical protein
MKTSKFRVTLAVGLANNTWYESVVEFGLAGNASRLVAQARALDAKQKELDEHDMECSFITPIHIEEVG